MKKITIILSLLFTLSVNAQTNGVQYSAPAANQDSISVGIAGSTNTVIANQPGNQNNAVVAPMYCQNRTMTWVSFGNTCTGTASMTNEGANRTVVSTGTNTGTVTYTCSNNNFVNPTNPTCSAPAPVAAATGTGGACNGYLVNYGTVCMQPSGGPGGACGMGGCFSPYSYGSGGVGAPVPPACGMAGC